MFPVRLSRYVVLEHLKNFSEHTYPSINVVPLQWNIIPQGMFAIARSDMKI